MTLYRTFFKKYATSLLPASLVLASFHSAAQVATPAALSPDAATDAVQFSRESPRYLLMGTHGDAVTSEDFRERFQLIAFGFVSCPDVCPTTLLEMQQVLAALGERAQHLQPIFITIDPQRDTLEVLKAYTANFDKRILGLTGSDALVRFAAKNFKVEYTKVQEPGAGTNVYTMDHTAGMFLLGPDGQLLKKFAYHTPVPEITGQIEHWMDESGRLDQLKTKQKP